MLRKKQEALKHTRRKRDVLQWTIQSRKNTHPNRPIVFQGREYTLEELRTQYDKTRALVKQLWAEIRNLENSIHPAVAKVLKSYTRLLRQEKERKWTREQILSHVKRFFRMFPEKSYSDITPEDILTFIEKISETNIETRIKGQLRDIADFYEALGVLGIYQRENPVRGILKRRNRQQITYRPKGTKPAPKEDAERLIRETFHPRDKFLFAILLETAMRVSEVSYLQLDDIEWTIMAFRSKGIYEGNKSKRDRWCLVSDKCWNLLHRYLAWREQEYGGNTERTYKLEKAETPYLFLGKVYSGQVSRLSANQIRWLFRKHCERIGIPVIKPHQLRTLWDKEAYKSGMDAILRYWQMGHIPPDKRNQISQMDQMYVKEELPERRRLHFLAAPIWRYVLPSKDCLSGPQPPYSRKTPPSPSHRCSTLESDFITRDLT